MDGRCHMAVDYIKHPARYPRDNVVQLETRQPES